MVILHFNRKWIEVMFIFGTCTKPIFFLMMKPYQLALNSIQILSITFFLNKIHCYVWYKIYQASNRDRYTALLRFKALQAGLPTFGCWHKLVVKMTDQSAPWRQYGKDGSKTMLWLVIVLNNFCNSYIISESNIVLQI